MWDQRTHPLGSLIEVLVEKHHLEEESIQDVIRDQWERIVGRELASQASPEKIDPSGRLIVRTANPVVRRELQFREEGMMTTLRSIPKCQHIEGVRLIAG